MTVPWDAEPLQTVRLTGPEWEALWHLLLTRSGGVCEVRSPDCMGDRLGDLRRLPRDRVSAHHRQPRQMGGSRAPWINDLCNILLACGSGVTGCHGWVESNRDVAVARGLLVWKGTPQRPIHPADVPVVLASGRSVLLHPTAPLYLTPPGGGWL